MLDDQRPRRVVPRWRSSWVTATTAEARSKNKKATSPEAKERISREVEAKERELSIIGSVPVAAELMFLASSVGDQQLAKRAALKILDSQERIGETPLVHSARRIATADTTKRIEEIAGNFVRHGRSLLAVEYRNPILLIDIARELTARRHEKSARRYVRSAIALAPHSRFVVRAAARYYLHIGEEDTAHDLLLRSPLLRNDPWVQASEIAVATVVGKTSALLKRTIRSLDANNEVGVDRSELASAVATVEMMSGANKKAKELFKQALLHPNDNSLAQAEWAATKLKLVVDERVLNIPMSFEANSHNAYRHQQMGDAIRHAMDWELDEPFSSRPLDAQAYLFNLEGKYADALAAATKACGLDGDNFALALNRLFSQIQMGDLVGAAEELARLGRRADVKSHATHFLANVGALAYAAEDYDLARKMYQRAIRSARLRSEPRSEALARAFFARMATESGDPQSERIVKEQAEIVIRLPSVGAIYVMQGLTSEPRRKELKKISLARNAKQKWQWDSISNTILLLDN